MIASCSHLAPRASRFAAALLCLFASGAAGVDWPAYRGDAARSGWTAEPLPGKLALRWTYKARHAPRPAWSGRDTRMPFDKAYHTVVAGKTLFFGSSADGKVYALDAATGVERWAFYTGAPVRFAPVVWQGRVFVASDDGFLYCLAAGDGKVLWKRRGGPLDSRLLGNDTMISRWPARGGPAIAEGILYFAAGIWPSEGIFLYALDAATGEVKWCNDTAGSMYLPQPHGGANARSGVSAQGYLVVAGDKLIVPTGRGVPAVFNRADGRFLYFHLQRYGGHGGSQIVSTASEFFNRGSIFDVASGGLRQSRINTAALAVTPNHVVYATSKALVAIDRANMWTQRQAVDRKGKKITKMELSSPVWTMESPYPSMRSLIVAGDTLVAGGAKGVSVVDRTSKQPLLSAEVDGVPYGLAVAGGRLFVSTDKGTIYCFAGDASGPASVVEAKREPSPYGDNAAFAAAAEEIVGRTGVTEGYCLDLACGDGRLAYELARRTRLQICSVDPDPAHVAAARRKLDAAGLYGVRVTVHQANPASTPYPNSFANLVVSGRSIVEGAAVVPAKEMQRLQRPYGGVACIGKPGAMKKTVRGPLDRAGTWTHQYCDPANTNCSTDPVRGPLGLLWFTDLNFQMPSRHGRGPAPLFYDGRLFVEGMNALRCVDAYNGRTVWEYPLPGVLRFYDADHIMGASGTGSNFCVGPEGLFVVAGGTCLKLHPATGKLMAEFPAPEQPDGKPGTWGAIACLDGTLFGTLSDTAHVVKWCWRPGDMRTQFTESLLLFAMDATSGKLKWRYTPEHSIRNNSIAIGRGRVYVIDRPVALIDLLDQQAAKRRGRPVAVHPAGTLMALNATDGKLAWQVADNIYGTMLALSEEHGVLVMAYQDTRYKLKSELGGKMAAFRAADGKRLWDVQAKYGSRLILNGRTIYAQPAAWDLLTGEQKGFRFKRTYGCGTVSGSRNLMLFRSGTLGYVDLTGDYGTEDYGPVRPGCWINAIAAGGLVLMPDATDRCRCSYLIKSSVALQRYGLRAPTIAPDGATSRTPVAVTLTAEAPRAEIRYTLDGSTPTRGTGALACEKASGSHGRGGRATFAPVKLTKSATLRARAFADRMPPSQVTEASFVIDPNIIAIAGPQWRVHDAPGAGPPKSRWEVAHGVVTELSNLYKGDAKITDPAMERSGTLRIYQPGKEWTDGELTLDIASSDNDVLGVAFRLGGADKYYLWAMDAQRSFHVLACKNGDTYRALASNQKSYRSNRWYKLRIVLKGPKIAVTLDGEKDLEATDDTLRTGTFALYAWGCAGAKFRNVRWK